MWLATIREITVTRKINPNSHAPFFVSRLSPRKGRGPKMGVPRLGFEPGASRTKCTPPGCRCPGSDFVPIWDPLLWRNRTERIFFTSPCWILLDCGRLGLNKLKIWCLIHSNYGTHHFTLQQGKFVLFIQVLILPCYRNANKSIYTV